MHSDNENFVFKKYLYVEELLKWYLHVFCSLTDFIRLQKKAFFIN